MNKDQAIGAAVMILGIAGIVVYGLLLYTYPIVVLQLSMFIAVAAILLILAWIGWTLASTPSPPAIEEEPAPSSAPKTEQQNSA